MIDNLKKSILSPLELRAKLEDMVRADLLGPAGGPDKIVDERNVRDRYIVGRWPQAVSAFCPASKMMGEPMPKRRQRIAGRCHCFR